MYPASDIKSLIKSKSVVQFPILCVIVIIYFLLCSIESYSQPNKRTNFWYCKDSIGLNFNSGIPVEDTLGVVGQAMMGTCSSVMSDTNGNLLFYSNGRNVWNRQHQVMNNGYVGPPYYVGTQSSISFPKPESDSLFYIFTSRYIEEQFPMFYYIVDMSLDNGLGEVSEVISLPSYCDAAEKLTAVYHKNKKDLWVITRSFRDKRYAAFQVTSEGVNINPVFSPAPEETFSSAWDFAGIMKISYDKKYMVSCFPGAGFTRAKVEVCKINIEDGSINHLYSFRLRELVYASPPYRTFSCEFSPDSKYMYLAGVIFTDSITHVFQFDMQYIEDSTLFEQSITQIGEGQGNNLQLASDGKIYCFGIDPYLTWFYPENNYVGIIHNPEKQAFACNYQANAFLIEHGTVRFGQVNFVTDFLFRFDFEGICESDTFNFDPWFFPEPVFIEWNFGDLASGSNNTSTIPHATHVFSDGGTYEVSVHVEYPNGRIEETSRKVEVEYAPEPNLGPDTTICTGTDIILNAECGPHFYLWSTGQFGISEITVSDTGWYWVRVTSNAGCFEIDSIHIVFYPPAIADTSNLIISPTTCGGSIGAIRGLAVSGNPPFQYQWIDDLGNPIANTIDIFHLPVGNYTLQVTDSNNCITEFGPYSIYDAGDVLIEDVGYTSEHCNQQNGSIIVTATSGLGDMLFYSINNGSNYFTNQGIFTGLPSGTYAVRVKDSTDCQDVYINNPIIIENIPGPQVTDVQITSASVGQNNGAINIIASGNSDTLFYSNDNGANYQINDGLFTDLFPGYYTCIVMDKFGCDTTFIVEVPEDVTIRLQAVAGDDEVCPGNSAFVPLIVSNFNDVGNFKTTLLYNKNLLTCSGFANAHPQLEDSLEALLFPAEGKIELHWSSAAITLTDTTTMTDLVFESIDPGISLIEWDGSPGASLFQNSTGLTIPVDYFIGNVKIYKEVDFSMWGTTEVCQGETLELEPIVWSSNGDVTWLWTDPNGTTSTDEIMTINNIQPNQSGTYSLTVTDTLDCYSDATVDVIVYPTPVPGFAGQDTITTEEPVEIDAGANYASYLWNTGESTQQITATYDGWYGVIIESLHGCMGEDSVYVLFFEPPLPPEPINENIYIPNAFSPDGDGLNDEFKVISNSEYISSFRMYIYNRWGTLVFESKDIFEGWDGRYKGNPAPQGVYVYKIEYSNGTSPQEESRLMSGTVMLVR